MVLTDVIARAGLPIEIFVLDTGRLHADSALSDRQDPRATTASTCASTRPTPARSPTTSAATGATLSTAASSCASAAARSARSSRWRARSPASAPGSPGSAARRRRAAPSSPSASSTHAHRPGEIQSARGLDRDRRLGLHPRATRAVQPPLRPGLPLDRLRALHAPRDARRGPARRPLVVGEARAQGMRAAHHAGRSRGPRQEPHERRPRAQPGRAAGPHATSTGWSRRRSTSCARSPGSARRRCCSSPAARTRSCCCASPRRRSVRGASRSR